MIFGGRLPIWPFPEKSVGQLCTMNIRGTQCWEALGPAGDAMKELYPHIKHLLENNQELLEQGEEKPRIIGFNLWMEGNSPGTSQPVIVFSSKSCGQRTRAKMLLKQSGLLNGYPGIKIKTLDRMPAIYRTHWHEQERVGMYPRPQNTLTTPEDSFVFIHGDHDVACGASISFRNIRPATLAGLISVNGVYYGLTAQHGRFKPREALGPVARSDEILAFDEDSDEGDCQDAEITSRANELNPFIEINTVHHNQQPFQRTQEAWLPIDSSTALTRESSMRSSDQVSRLKAPGMDYVRKLDPGMIIAKISEDSPPNDLDYELFRLYNVEGKVNCITIPGIGGAGVMYPQRIATAAAECEVLAATGTTGTVRGTMISNAYYIRLENSSTYQELWAVKLERETMLGDCGSWVVNARNGEIYGHVVAGDISSGLAYIIPAYKVFDDIDLRFGSRPVLPAQTVTDKPRASELIQKLDDLRRIVNQQAGAEIARDSNETLSIASRRTEGDTSSPKLIQALKQPITPAILPPRLTFIVKIQEIRPDYSVQPNRSTENKNGFFLPPDRRTAFYQGDATYFRWQHGRMSTLSDPNGWIFALLDESGPSKYSVATIFSQKHDTDHLLAVNFNASAKDVASYDPGWRVLRFDHVSQQSSSSTYSSINLSGEQKHLAASGSPTWMDQLLPRLYDYQHSTPGGGPIPSPTMSAGLIGSLPILIGLAAFSAPRESLRTVLLGSIRTRAWRRHDLPTGRTPERGMVVTIYYDPMNHGSSTKDILDRLESGALGPFYA